MLPRSSTAGLSATQRVIWTNYKKELDTYQSALEHKESYMRALMNIRADSIDGYATNNISHVLGFVRAECVAIARSDVARRFDLAAD